MKLRLEGVNALLRTIGEIPLVDENDFALSDEAVQAEIQINATLVSVLSKGFKFNRFKATLQPDTEGYIAVPPNTLVMEFEDNNLSINDGLVFNRETFSSKFTNSINVEITYKEQFDYIPIVIQEHIIAEASYIFQRDTVNDPAKSAELNNTRQETKRELNIYSIRQYKINGRDPKFDRNSNPVAS